MEYVYAIVLLITFSILTELNAAVKRNQASNAASIARLTSGLDVLTKGRLPKIEADLAGLVSEHCLLSDWGQWSKCSKSCGGGTTERSRAVIKQAINSIPCSSFRLKEMQACNSLPCTVDLCNGNERWYNLNSGDLEVIVSSHYTKGTQDILHFVMGATTGSGPSGPTDVMVVKADAVAGEHTIYASNTLRSAQTGLPPRTQGKFASGDYICGTLGGIEVLGSAADPLGDANRHRSWVPARLRGRKFVVPVTRGNPQVLMILAIESDTTVMLKVAGQPRTIYALRGQVRVVQTNAATRSIDLEANKDILVTYVGGTVPGYNEAGVLTSNPIGNGDYFAIPPATDSDTLYGVAGSSAFVAVATAKICLLSATSDNGDVIKQTLSPGQNLMLPDSLGLGFDAIDFDGPVITANCTEVIAGSTGIVGVVTFDTVSGDVEGAAVAWLPRSVMRTFFLFPFDAHRVTFVCLVRIYLILLNSFFLP